MPHTCDIFRDGIIPETPILRNICTSHVRHVLMLTSRYTVVVEIKPPASMCIGCNWVHSAEGTMLISRKCGVCHSSNTAISHKYISKVRIGCALVFRMDPSSIDSLPFYQLFGQKMERVRNEIYYEQILLPNLRHHVVTVGCSNHSPTSAHS